MKLSECWIGRIVQDKDKTYDETMSSYSLGHVEGFEVLNGNIYYKYYTPEQLKPLED